MNQKRLFNLIIIFTPLILILNLNFVCGVGFSSTDTFTSDSSSGTDAKTFEDRDLDFTIESSSIMVACYDWYNGNCDENPTYDTCFAANQQDFDDCEAYDSWLTGMGYTTDSTPETQEMDTSTESHACFDGRYYKNCDGLGGGNLYGITERVYSIFSRRWFDCDDGSPSWYTYDAEGYVAPYSYDYKDEIACPTNKKCSEDDDSVWVYTYDGAITNPCRWDDGQSCSADSDCWSKECVHSICRPTDPYCGDSYCDAGETYSSCEEDCCDNDCTGYSDITCRSVCDTYNGCGFYSSATKSACNGETYVDTVCVDANTYVDCCEGTATDCSSGYYCSYGSCYACDGGCDNVCPSSACYGTDPDCDEDGNPTLTCCGDGECDGGETVSCSFDCCESDCTAVYDSICHNECDMGGEGGCYFTAGCDGQSSGSYCVDADTKRTCCEGDTIDCAGDEYCSGGSCLSCSTVCDDSCQSSACYGTDPDCDENGDPTLECGNETDMEIVDVIPIQVIPYVDMVKGKSGYVRVIVRNNGPLGATAVVNITFDGSPLAPYNPANAERSITNGNNATYDFYFKPMEAGNNKEIVANVTIVS